MLMLWRVLSTLMILTTLGIAGPYSLVISLPISYVWWIYTDE